MSAVTGWVSGKVTVEGLNNRLAEVLPIVHDEAAPADESASFPVASLDAIRKSGLMGLLIPTQYGGLGGGLEDMAHVAAELAGACMSTAMIWAMHCQQVAAMVEHGTSSLKNIALPAIARGEIYVASVTSEKKKGGHLLTADAPLTAEHGQLFIDRDAPIVTGGAFADAFLVTMRDQIDARPDRVSLVYVHREDLELVAGEGNWNPMGMRATDSVPLRLRGALDEDRLIGGRGEFHTVAVSTFIPTGHVAWSACWIGGARAALRSVLQLLRDPKTRGQFDLSSDLLRDRLARVRLELDAMSGLLAQVIRDSQSAGDLSEVPIQLRLNGLKIFTAERSKQVVDILIEIAGLRFGYMRDSPLPLERLYRDLRSASLNYANDRLLSANGAMALVDRNVTLAF
ncbi:acyl-CoA dehydrogenase family protein [Arthrobacter sp. E44]|uniref:acyl-CoA dehydrogenase family protein n=1 Tax=Arthrobacter sp. E44 TaxID=3341794 RepID=UPI0035A65EFE